MTLVDDSGFPRERIWKLLRQSGVTLDMSDYYRHYDYITKILFDWRKIDTFLKVREIHKQRLASFYQKYNVNRNVEDDLEYLLRSMKECKIYPEVPNMIEKIKRKYKIALISNADDDDPLINILINKGFSFDAIITSESVRAYKPHSAIFKKALDKLKLDKDQLLLVGDSQVSDILGGKRFGLKVVWLNRSDVTLESGMPQPDYIISNLSDLLDIV